MPTKKPPVKPIVESEVEFPIVTAETLKKHIELSPYQLATHRRLLTKDIHWFQRIPGAEVLYNLRLWKHFILAGRGQEHDRLIEQYLEYLKKI